MTNIEDNKNNLVINKRFESDIYDQETGKIILEQWKTAVEFAKEVSTRRLTMNGLFLTGLSILTGGILFGNGLMFLSSIQRNVIVISICILGIVLCRLWVRQLTYYYELNKTKYKVVRELEKYLPVFVYNYENTAFYRSNDDNKSFSKLEKRVPMIFGVIFLLIIVVITIPYVKNIFTCLFNSNFLKTI